MKQLNLVEDSLLPSLLKFTIPILFALLLQTAYGTVDLLIVSRYSSVAEVSAVTIGSQIMQSITSICTGLAIGTTILIGKYMGSGKKNETSQVVGVSIILFSYLGFILAGILVFFHPLIVEVMKTPQESIAQTESYLLVSGIGTLFIVYYNLIASVFRGIGDSNTPLLTVLIACIINIILDLVLVAVLQLGATGAAIATIIAQGVSVILSLFMLRKKTLPFELTKEYRKFLPNVSKDILTLGIPVALQGVLVSISFLVITSIVNTFGVESSAGVGIVEKITGIVMVVPIAFMQSLSAFTAQNMGANQISRAKRSLYYSIALSLTFGVVTAYLCAFHGTMFTDLFIKDDPATTAAAISYLKSYALDCVFVAIMFSFSGFFNGCGKTTFVMVQAVVGACFIRIPLAFYLSTLPNTSLFLIGLATPSSTFVQILLFLWYYNKENKVGILKET